MNILDQCRDPKSTPVDFIVVGAGAGGAPLATRLAERGFTVLVMEMGPRGEETPEDGPAPVVENTRVPLLHPETTEDERHSLRFFVKHFDHDPVSSRDPKVHKPEAGNETHAGEEGVFYPRSQGLGGCTVHNAMITVAGPSEDWDEIAEATGDESWRGSRMRAYFERLENCHYDNPTLKGRIGRWFGFGTGWEHTRARHGDAGWLDTTVADLSLLVREKRFLRVVLDAALETFEAGVERFGGLVRSVLRGRAAPHLDPNHWETMRRSLEGLVRIPCAITPKGERSSPRERLLGVAEGDSPAADRLHIATGVCVTEVILESVHGKEPIGGCPAEHRATGVQCVAKAHVYRADPKSDASAKWQDLKVLQQPVYCRREVILCGGSFNTPQLLMLSGIGPADHIQEKKGKEATVNLVGVGGNLQDRYEVPVVATVKDRFRTLDTVGLTSKGPDALADTELQRWRLNAGRPAKKRGLYATNGGLIGIIKRSGQEESKPDLFIFALAGYFPGYSVGWSKPDRLAPGEAPRPGSAASHKRWLTWLVLKARTRHRGGTVRLHDNSPLTRPEINFRSFPSAPDDGDLEGKDDDLEALLEGVRFVQRILKRGQQSKTIDEVRLPDLEKFDDNVRAWIKHVAWGHHACGTCRIGADDDAGAVLDSRFRVRGVCGLRVVDASVFPRIPGFFIVTNVYMVSEKAADVLTEDHLGDESQLPPDAVSALRANPVLWSSVAAAERVSYPRELEREEAQLIAKRRRQAFRNTEKPKQETP